MFFVIIPHLQTPVKYEALYMFIIKLKQKIPSLLTRYLSGVPWGIRTPDLLLRRQLLYPTELKAQAYKLYKWRTKMRHSLERVMGIEPTRPAWKAGILPLNYTRIFTRQSQNCPNMIPHFFSFVNTNFEISQKIFWHTFFCLKLLLKRSKCGKIVIISCDHF